MESSTHHGPLDKSRTSDAGLEMGAMDASDLSDSDDSETKTEGDGIFRESLESALESQSLPSLETGSRRRHRRAMNRSFQHPLSSNGAGKDTVVSKPSRDAIDVEAGWRFAQGCVPTAKNADHVSRSRFLKVRSNKPLQNLVANFRRLQR